MPLGRDEIELGSGDIVLDGDPAPPNKGPHPHLSTGIYSGQTAGWIKMPVGTEVELGPGHLMLDGDPLLLRRGCIRGCIS